MNNGYIVILSVWKQSTKCPKCVIRINPNTLQFVEHHRLNENNCIDPLLHDIEHFASYTNTIKIKRNKTSYSFVLSHGGTATDRLQTMTLRQLFDCNGRIFKELVLNITNEIRLIALINNSDDDNERIDGDSLLWIGKKIQLNEFIDIPMLYGHRMTNIGGNTLVITGGIGEQCGTMKYSETFSFAIPCIDKIIENALNCYSRNLSIKYRKATNSKTYQKQIGKIGANKQSKTNQSQQTKQSNSNKTKIAK